MKSDLRFMRLALAQARLGLGRTSPNPPVGALVVKRGQVVGRGYHHRAGEPHAEVEALKKAGQEASGATMYVTLEPCDHEGRTPPCSLSLIHAGIRRVVVGCRDPNHEISGGGIRRLIKAGIQVDCGVLEQECQELIEAFTVTVQKKRVFVTLKAAMTLDGRIATRTGHSHWISGPEALRYAHRLRDRLDAILVGGNTIRRDDPKLTCRLPGGRSRDPVRVILSSSLDLSPQAQVFHAFSKGERPRVIVATTRNAPARPARALAEVGAEIWRLPGRGGRVDLLGLVSRLCEIGLMSVLVEGGSEVHGAFIGSGLCDRLVIVVAPKLICGSQAVPVVGGEGPRTMAGAIPLTQVKRKLLGDDLLVTGIPDFTVSGFGKARSAR